jgi:hypothetical protein
MNELRVGQRWASGLAPGCDLATVYGMFEHNGVPCVKHSYFTADGWSGRDTLTRDEFMVQYPLFVEQAFEEFS